MKKGRFLIFSGLLLIAAALGLSLYNVWDDQRADRDAEYALQQLTPQLQQAAAQAPVFQSAPPPQSAGADPAVEYPDYLLNPEMEPPVFTVNGNSYIGILTIPALERRLPILKQCSDGNLKIAPCCYSGSPYLNDFIIAAHSYIKHFGRLSALHIGDKVTFTDMDGNFFEYEVIEITVLPPTAVEEMAAGEWDLTLFTCTVSGQDRVTVRCALRQDMPS